MEMTELKYAMPKAQRRAIVSAVREYIRCGGDPRGERVRDAIADARFLSRKIREGKRKDRLLSRRATAR